MSHGSELRDFWAEQQRRYRAKKKGWNYKPRFIPKEDVDPFAECLDALLAFQEMENEECLEKNIFKRGL